MTDHFNRLGHSLIENGYLILPIRRGEKRPAIGAWQKARISDADLSQFPGHGVGVLCGQGVNPIVGIDIDISHPVIGPAVIEWCRIHMGHSAERIGAAPRMLMVYRASESGWAKGNSVMFFDPEDPDKPSGKPNNQQVEILGLGQQFVAYHVHPDTGKDYEWVDLFGGIAQIPARDLPIINEAQIDALMAEVYRLVTVTSGVRVTSSAASPMQSLAEVDALSGVSPPVGKPIEEVRELMTHLDNSEMGVDYDTWVRVGMALHHEYAGSPDALALWKSWGSQSTKDDPRGYEYKWQSFAKSGRSPTTLRWLLKVCNQNKRDAELHLIVASLDEIKLAIAECDDTFKLTNTIAELIRVKMPDDAGMRVQVQSWFQSRFKALTGTALPAAELRKMLMNDTRAQTATVKARRPLTEFGNAERMLDRYAANLMYVADMEKWFKWTGNYWKMITHTEVEYFAKETIKALVNEIEDHPDPAEFFEFCAASQRAQMVGNMVRLAQSDSRVVAMSEDLDKRSELLGVENGVVDLTTGLLLPADPGYRITKVCGAKYFPEAKCPLFERTVSDAFFGDAEMIGYFMRCLGYMIGGNPTEDIMFIPFGNGSNGKSTILGTVRQAFGTYAKACDASSFVSDGKGGGNAGGAREDLVRLKAARLIYVNEPDEGGELREGAVKAMTGGDAIVARSVYGKFSIEFKPTGVVVMPTNHKPIIKGSDNGVWRRMGLIPFLRNFENDPLVVKDPMREEKLLAELAGILALIVRAHLEYRLFGLQQPGSVKQARESYRSDMDLLAEWLGECCETGEGYESDSASLWSSWEAFAKRHGLLNYIRSSPALGRRLDSRFPAKKASGGRRVRTGIRLKQIFGESSFIPELQSGGSGGI